MKGNIIGRGKHCTLNKLDKTNACLKFIETSYIYAPISKISINSKNFSKSFMHVYRHEKKYNYTSIYLYG